MDIGVKILIRLLGAVFMVVPLLFYVFIGKVYYNKINKNPEKTMIYFAISIFTLTFIPFGVVFFIVASQYNKKYEEKISKILVSANNETVEEFIQFLSTNPVQNNPNSWHRLRGVWYTVNECSSVSIEKKNQLLKLLLTKGLYLTSEEKQIISN